MTATASTRENGGGAEDDADTNTNNGSATTASTATAISAASSAQGTPNNGPTTRAREKRRAGTGSAPAAAALEQPSMTIAFIVYFVVPISLIALMTLYGHLTAGKGTGSSSSTGRRTTTEAAPRRRTIVFEDPILTEMKQKYLSSPSSTSSSSPSSPPLLSYHDDLGSKKLLSMETQQRKKRMEPSARTTHNWPGKEQQQPQKGGGEHKEKTKYQQEVEALVERKKKKRKKISENQKRFSPTTPRERTTDRMLEGGMQGFQPPSQARHQDDARRQVDERIDVIRKEYKKNPNDAFAALRLAEALRERDLSFHDGGTAQVEAIRTYHAALRLVKSQRESLRQAGEPTNVTKSGQTLSSLNDEILLDFSAKSVDGLLASVYSNLGKMYFMANMFERAVKAYSGALAIDPNYMDALTYRASAFIILGQYEEAGRDYTRVLELDTHRMYVDAFTGMARILVAKEEAIPGGWGPMIQLLEDLIPQTEAKLSLVHDQGKKILTDHLKRMHLAMFAYHDTKTNNTDQAWWHLSEAHRYQLSVLPPFGGEMERQRVMAVKQVFQRGFWPEGIGHPSRTPIFIVGFVRSGSTLLERVLDAHPLIVGTGEDSVFNGRLDMIRNTIVEASVAFGNVKEVVDDLAEGVIRDMKVRWKRIEKNSAKDAQTGKKDDGGEEDDKSKVEPQRFADKMLTNYMNVGFIHMLFPNALILHVAREPMDTAFSAFKHDFPGGTLDYTSEFRSLAQLYHGYRDMMEHWEKVLPGRVTHVRYEDMVHDMPGVARAIINATDLPWDPTVLDFHKKKHAVNTLSTTQVRKGLYKDSLNSWRRYEQYLQPLVELLGDRARYDLKTTLPHYTPPPLTACMEEEKDSQ